MAEEKKCSFDWADFHNKLDIAVAHMIDENSKYPNICLPSKTTIYELMQYSFKKKEQGGCFPKNDMEHKE